jgi:hypothetical protein
VRDAGRRQVSLDRGPRARIEGVKRDQLAR